MAEKIVIFGGSGGIGSATARLLHGAGKDLNLVGRNSEGLQTLAEDLGVTTTIGDVTDPALFKEVAETITSQHALKRLGTAADMANLTAFLMSDQASWITGQVLGVDGGRSTLRTAG